MQLDHVAWRSERADVLDLQRPVGIEVLEEAPGSLTIIGRGPSQKQAVLQVHEEAARRGLPQEELPNPSDYSGVRDRFDIWCAATWSTSDGR